MYEVLLERRAERDLKNLPPDVFRRVVEALRPLVDDPRPGGCRELSGSTSDYRLRVGSYRILYEIDDDRREVRVMRVRHRREAYRT